jgi:hypothetical protein
MSAAPLGSVARWLLLCTALLLGGCVPADESLPELPFSALEQEVDKGNVIRIRFEPKVTVAECTLVPEAAQQAGIDATSFQVKLPEEAKQRITFIRQCARQGVSMMQYH